MEESKSAKSAVVILAALLVLMAGDYLVLRELGVSYFRWYIANGPLLSLFLAALAAGIDLDRDPTLVASNAASFVAGWLTVPGIVFLEFAALLRVNRETDGMLTVLFAVPLVVIWACYLVVIAPLQYVVTLAAGAPVRLALARTERSWVERHGRHIAIKHGPAESMPDGVDQIDVAARPVTTTNAFAAVLLFALSLFL